MIEFKIKRDEFNDYELSFDDNVIKLTEREFLSFISVAYAVKNDGNTESVRWRAL